MQYDPKTYMAMVQLIILSLLITMSTPLASATPAKPALQKTATPAIKITHSTVSQLPSARTIITPSTQEIDWIKNQTNLDFKLVPPKKTVLKPGLIKAFSEGRALQILVSARSAEDSFFLRIQSSGSGKATCTVRTIHEACPQWIETLIKQSVEQVWANARSRQRKIIGVGGIATAVIGGAIYKKHVDEQRRRAEAEARQRVLDEQHRREMEEAPSRARIQEAKAREASLTDVANTTTAFRREFKRWLLRIPFWKLTVRPGSFTVNRSAPQWDTNKDAAGNFNSFCFGHKQANLGLKNEAFELKEDDFDTFFRGSFAEETIDLLARFQQNYMIALGTDLTAVYDVNDTERVKAKATALETLKHEVRQLQKSNPMEAKRLLCFHPMAIWDLLQGESFYTEYINKLPLRPYADYRSRWTPITTGNVSTERIPYGSIGLYSPGETWPTRFPSFKAMLDACFAGKLCLKDYFPCNIAMFEGLHLVSAAV